MPEGTFSVTKAELGDVAKVDFVLGVAQPFNLELLFRKRAVSLHLIA